MRYGEDKIRRLCQRFNVDVTGCLSGMQDYIDSKGSDMPKELLPLKNLIHTFVISTAECGRSFNQMNLICTPVRSSLLVKNMAASLFININGPPLSEINIQQYAKLFLHSGHRSAEDPRSKKTSNCLRVEVQSPKMAVK